jgi:hypothetical protein
MSRQSLTQAAIAPHQVHQGLFLLLAIIVTLLIAQQVQRWNDVHAPAVSIRTTSSHHLAPVQARMSADRAPALQHVERRVTEDTAQPRWVF